MDDLRPARIAPPSVLFEDNVLWNSPGGDRADFIRVLKGVRQPVFRGNIFFGSPVGLDPVPDGIEVTDPGLEKDPRGLWLRRDGKGASPSLLSEADCGPATYRPGDLTR